MGVFLVSVLDLKAQDFCFASLQLQANILSQTQQQCRGGMAAQWYAISTHQLHEQRVMRALNDQYYETYLPLVRSEHRRRDGLLVARMRPVFPSYLFVSFDIALRRWQEICCVRGVKSFVGQPVGDPLAIPSEEMIALRQAIADLAESFLYKSNQPITLRAGMLVRVLFGPFRDQSALVQEDCGSRVDVLLQSTIGRQKRSWKCKLPKDCIGLFDCG